jgi:hypothetical protein
MNPCVPSLSLWLARSRRRILAGALATLMVACGGGVGVGGTGGDAVVHGTISGFGSVIVNGIRFDDSTARIETDDGVALERSALGLGMVAEVESGPITGSATDRSATASRIRIASELIGPVQSVDAGGDRFVAIGQTVRVTATTVYGDTLGGGLAALRAGEPVEVYGNLDIAAGQIVATRIDRLASLPSRLRVRGSVAALDTASHRFRIGTANFVYAPDDAPASLADGSLVRLDLEATPDGAGRWVVRRFDDGRRRLPDVDEAEIEGAITSFTSTREFSVNGQPVIADASTQFPDGEAGIRLGAIVEVQGAVVGGVLRATEIEVEDEDDEDEGFDLRGTVSALDTAARTFVVQGQTVDYGQSPRFEDGSAADLRDGVEVRVRARTGSPGGALVATEVKFED